MFFVAQSLLLETIDLLKICIHIRANHFIRPAIHSFVHIHRTCRIIRICPTKAIIVFYITLARDARHRSDPRSLHA